MIQALENTARRKCNTQITGSEILDVSLKCSFFFPVPQLHQGSHILDMSTYGFLVVLEVQSVDAQGNVVML